MELNFGLFNQKVTDLCQPLVRVLAHWSVENKRYTVFGTLPSRWMLQNLTRQRSCATSKHIRMASAPNVSSPNA